MVRFVAARRGVRLTDAEVAGLVRGSCRIGDLSIDELEEALHRVGAAPRRLVGTRARQEAIRDGRTLILVYPSRHTPWMAGWQQRVWRLIPDRVRHSVVVDVEADRILVWDPSWFHGGLRFSGAAEFAGLVHDLAETTVIRLDAARGHA